MDAKLWVPEYDAPELWHKEISRRCFVKSGISGFLGLVAMQHFSSSSLAQLENIVPRAKRCIVLCADERTPRAVRSDVRNAPQGVG